MSSSIFYELINGTNLPEYFDTLPYPSQGIQLLYSGSNGQVTIQSGTLTTLIDGGSGANLSYSLDEYTLGSLVTAINTNTGYTATLVGTTSISALALMEVQAGDIVTSTYNLNIFTSIVWQLFTVLAKALNNARQQVTGGITEQFILEADGNWVDYWGLIYGDQIRSTGELDNTFANQILDEITRNRLAAVDIAASVEQELFQQVAIFYGQHDIVQIASQSIVGAGIIGDRAHCLNQFYVIPLDSAIVPATETVVNANRAAGINPIFTGYTTPELNADLAMFPMVLPFPISPII